MSAIADPLLVVNNLAVEIPTAVGTLHAVRGVSFLVSRGKTLCIVGESGCGKSLTALALMDLLPQRARRMAERLVFDGIELLGLRRSAMDRLRGNRISMIFQEPMTSLNPAFTVGQQLSDVLRQHTGASRAEARERAIYLLHRVGISGAESRLKQYPHELSGGLRQRIMIAMALMCGPDLILADEPTTALDVTIQAELLRLLIDLQQEFKMAMVLITHDLGVVSRVADHVIVMYAGQVVEAGTVEQIFEDPLHPYTQGLLACLPVPGRTAPMARLPSIPGMVPPLIGPQTGCSFRDRCRYARAECEGAIDLRSTEAGHAYRCIQDERTARSSEVRLVYT